MPSAAYRKWATTTAKTLDEFAQVHRIVGGKGQGRRHALQQVNQAYAVLLAAHFQGFCRDLHTECAAHLALTLTALPATRLVLEVEFTSARQLDRGNAQPSSIGADFGRFGIDLWPEVIRLNPRNEVRQAALEMLNRWRNAIAHQNFDPVRLGGTVTLPLARVVKWRVACKHLARAFDEVLRLHLQTLTGQAPW